MLFHRSSQVSRSAASTALCLHLLGGLHALHLKKLFTETPQIKPGCPFFLLYCHTVVLHETPHSTKKWWKFTPLVSLQMAGILQIYHVYPDTLWGIENTPYTQRTMVLMALCKTETTCRTQKNPTFTSLLKSQQNNRYVNTGLGNDTGTSPFPTTVLQQLALMALSQINKAPLGRRDYWATGRHASIITFLIVTHSYTVSPGNPTCALRYPHSSLAHPLHASSEHIIVQPSKSRRCLHISFCAVMIPASPESYSDFYSFHPLRLDLWNVTEITLCSTY